MNDLKNYEFVKHFYDLESKNHWDYIGKKDKPIDKIAPYPAKMVSDMQGEIISSIKNEIEIKSIFDPFMGSGTILTESVSLKIPEIYGNDINPFSYLIVKVKTTKLNERSLKVHYTKLLNRIRDNQLIKNRYFSKITKWYEVDTIEQLSKILNEVEVIKNKDIKDFFELGFARLVKEVSNTRNTTFKLHIKEKEKITTIDNCLIRFKKIIDEQIKSCLEFWSEKEFDKIKVQLFNEDLRKLKVNKKFDMIITSPPYGDNKTTVTYGEFSILQLRWLGCDKYTDTYSAIDSASLGGTLCKTDEITEIEIYKKSNLVRQIVDQLSIETSSEKPRKVVTFMQDFFETMKNLNEHLNHSGTMILTVGNRKVNGNEIFFNKIIDEMAMAIGLKKLQEFSRNLPTTKKIASNTSKLKNGKSVKSMDKEYVLIYTK